MFLCSQMTVFTMDRNCIFRFYKGVDQLNLLLAGMSGYMDILENNLCTLHGQFVDNLGNCLFISGNRIGAENDGIVRLDRDLLVDIAAIRESAAMDSPWLPVVIRTTFSSG